MTSKKGTKPQTPKVTLTSLKREVRTLKEEHLRYSTEKEAEIAELGKELKSLGLSREALASHLKEEKERTNLALADCARLTLVLDSATEKLSDISKELNMMKANEKEVHNRYKKFQTRLHTYNSLGFWAKVKLAYSSERV